MIRLKQWVVGFARDFWNDGDEYPFLNRRTPIPRSPKQTKAQSQVILSSPAAVLPPEGDVSANWHAKPGEISEKMWGEGALVPGAESIADILIKPLALNSDMTILDLSAGLGERMRKVVKEFGVYITGLEPDQAIAARGMELLIKEGKKRQATITPYDPNNFSLDKKFNCVVFRETFYRVADKKKFVETIRGATKSKGQVSFTDYIVAADDRTKPAVAAWIANEKGAEPVSLESMVERWAGAGFDLRVHQDMTDLYSREVHQGLNRFTKFIKSGIHPDAETKRAIQRRIETWVHRTEAMKQGMKFYRFYGSYTR